MSWNFCSSASSSINTLLSSKETTLDQILEDAGLTTALRNSNTQLINFFTEDQNLNGLMDYALTNKEGLPDNGVKIVRAAVTALSYTSANLQRSLKGKPVFKERLNDFATTSFTSDPKIAGHYQRIVESMVRYTSGSFLEDLTSLRNFLINNMAVLGYRELFVTLVTDFTAPFKVDKELFIDLSKKANSDSGYYAVTSMLNIIKTKNDLKDNFFDAQTIANILDACIKNPNPLIRTESFRLIETIVNDAKTPDEIKNEVIKFEETFQFPNPDQVTCDTAWAVRVFPQKSFSLLPSFFHHSPNTFLNESLLNAFKSAPIETQIQLIKEYDLPNKLIEAICTNKCNGHLAELANYIVQQSAKTEYAELDKLKSPEWTDFLSKNDSWNLRLNMLINYEYQEPKSTTSSSSDEGFTQNDIEDFRGDYNDNSSDSDSDSDRDNDIIQGSSSDESEESYSDDDDFNKLQGHIDTPRFPLNNAEDQNDSDEDDENQIKPPINLIKPGDSNEENKALEEDSKPAEENAETGETQ